MKTGRLLKFPRPGGDVHAYLYQDGPLVRASLYRYRFTTPAERAATGDCWVRVPLGTYVPALRLSDWGPGDSAGEILIRHHFWGRAVTAGTLGAP